jgi:uncharacterized protein YukE
MTRIRVNTEDLKNKAKDFDSAADAFNRAGDDILAAAMAMPSYDGQLSGPARKAGYEIQSQARELKAALSNNAESLRKTAQSFEEVDNKTVGILRENTALMSNAPIFGGPGGENDAPIKQGGNPDLLGYEDYGDYVIFWKNDEPLTIVITDQNRAMVEQYEKAVDDYCKALAGLLDTWRDWILRGIGTDQLILLICVIYLLGFISEAIMAALGAALKLSPEAIALAKRAADAIVGGTGWDERGIMENFGLLLDPMDPYHYARDIEKFIQDLQALDKSYNDAERIWNVLAPTPTPSGPTPVSVPTPPTPTQTPTPSAP